MFAEIGGKIKTLAKVLCWIGIAFFVIYGIAFISNPEIIPSFKQFSENNALKVLIGLIIIIFGSIASWISSFTLYGFGELIDNSVSINSKLRFLSPETYLDKIKMNEAIEQEYLSKGGWKCDCGRLHEKDIQACICGKKRSELGK